MGGQSDGGACVDSRYNIARGTSFPSNGNYVKSLIVDDHGFSRRAAHAVGDPAPETLNEVSQNIDQIVRSLGNLLNGLS